MRDSNRPKPRAPAHSSPSNSPATPKVSSAPNQTTGKAAGRIVHDERGNAVWDWVVETGRIFIDSTSRLLRKLEAPELKIEDENAEPELHLESERDVGGGYDPYGRGKSEKSTGSANSRTPGASGNARCEGGGYDPYSKATPRKQGR
jgi:hypothetical protein